MSERKKLLWMLLAFAGAYFLPVDAPRVQGSLQEAFAMLHEYAREHVLLCLVPALFIAGAIGVFVSQAKVMKYLGPAASKLVAYPVAAVSGSILAVCSCTVLPLFAGIHRRGAGLGPAIAFLYAGPAINVMAIILTARVLGFELGVARAVAAIGFSVVLGLLMHLLFRNEEAKRTGAGVVLPEAPASGRTLGQDGAFFAAMLGVLVFANWARPAEGDGGIWATLFGAKWWIAGAFGVGLAAAVPRWFSKDELGEWVDSTWTFAKQILPLLFAGVLMAGFLLGRPDREGLVPSEWVAGLVGGNSVAANLFASVVGVFMYFATLTEVPVVQGLLGAGMGKGPALALLLAGPALSLPSMLVVHGVLGTRKTVAFVSLVILLSAAAGWLFGNLA